ncbi:MAG: threonine aldolase, partial [Pyrinomonadaceae bacterium]
TDNVWLENAQHANQSARQLTDRLRTEANIENVFPVDANAVFVRMSEQLVGLLQSRGWHFYKFVEPDVYRLMCSWATTDKAISDFIADIITTNH